MSDTRIKAPTQNQDDWGAVTGGIKGAAAGAAVGGPVGAAIGGIVGGIAGAFGDSAARHKSLAAQWARMGRVRSAAIQRRNVIREFRMRRALTTMSMGSEEGGMQSSATVGSQNSLEAQFGFGLNYFDTQQYINKKVNKQLNKAGRAQAQGGNLFGMLDAGLSLYSAGSDWMAAKKAGDDQLGDTMSQTGYDPI
jgi:hypothetical protein